MFCFASVADIFETTELKVFAGRAIDGWRILVVLVALNQQLEMTPCRILFGERVELDQDHSF